MLQTIPSAVALKTEDPKRPLGFHGDQTHKHLLPKLERLEQEHLGQVIRRLVRKESFTQELAQRLRVEFLRFISLRLVTDEPIAPPTLVDEFWHAFLVYTKDYADFCQIYFGRFIHHNPREHMGGPEVVDPSITKRLIVQLYPSYDREVWKDQAICDDYNYCDGD